MVEWKFKQKQRKYQIQGNLYSKILYIEVIALKQNKWIKQDFMIDHGFILLKIISKIKLFWTINNEFFNSHQLMLMSLLYRQLFSNFYSSLHSFIYYFFIFPLLPMIIIHGSETNYFNIQNQRRYHSIQTTEQYLQQPQLNQLRQHYQLHQLNSQYQQLTIVFQFSNQ